MLALPEEHLKKLESEAIYGTQFLLTVVDMKNTGSSMTPIGPDSHVRSISVQRIVPHSLGH